MAYANSMTDASPEVGVHFAVAAAAAGAVVVGGRLAFLAMAGEVSKRRLLKTVNRRMVKSSLTTSTWT